jgi:flavin reductase (DIM6/NTAB) family NADH-FMN oxidoreductase RutF
MQLDEHSIASMPNRRRAALINSLTGFKSANLVGTADVRGNTNLAIMSSAVHLGSHPPLIALIIRPGGEERHSLHNILTTGCFTINHVTQDIISAAHQTAARYEREVSEFEATGLTPQWQTGLAAPMVAEASVKLGMALREHQELQINGTHMVIGEIVLAEFPERALMDDGALNLAHCGSVALTGLDTYHAATPVRRMAYAKPELPPRELDMEPADAPQMLDVKATGAV